ncbi:head-tail connector protein [Moraxella sp. ZY210820]|uniref:head-tail connector protein n=1 Tax=unclassified Moraxella TaxID=2685852 RepID=UPI00273171CB|nr:head-tail connector protein [Moraxella sp. ZY210820]WLF83797.1 head-tail connector protein [Moraxella sp. ZY210820]
MMITLEQVKFQCRIEHDEEDDILTLYILSAQEFCQNYLDRKIYIDNAFDDETGIEITPIIKQAMLLLVAHWYAVRELTPNVPQSVYELLRPYRLMGV